MFTASSPFAEPSRVYLSSHRLGPVHLLVRTIASNKGILCAAGTVAVAAVGLTFARPSEGPSSARAPLPHQVVSSAVLHQDSVPGRAPETPVSSPQAQPASAPVTRLRKRTSSNRPLSASSRLSFGAWTRSSSDMRMKAGMDAKRDSVAEDWDGTEMGGNHDAGRDGDSVARSSWRRPRSLLQLSTPSNSTSPPPGSPSVAHSNGSTVPILPQQTNLGGNTMPRNKLVKRSSSQRALQGSSTMYSTLRRPATSHQRTATLQQHLLEGDAQRVETSRRRSGTPLIDLEEDSRQQDDVSDAAYDHDTLQQHWRPFFHTHVRRVLADGPAKRRPSTSAISRFENYRSIVPSVHDVPTLMLGGSVSTHSSDGSTEVTDPLNNNVSRPITPMLFDNDRPRTIGSIEQEIEIDPTPKSRRSFSLGGFFSTPSPSAWKMSRSGSIRRSSLFTPSTSKRRVFSAPQDSRAQGSKSRILGESLRPGRRRMQPGEKSPAVRAGSVPRGSALWSSPQGHRLSAFEFELPGAAPLYPDSSPTPPPPSSPSPNSPVLPPSPSPFHSSNARNRAHRPSGSPSDFTSTLASSENDNSRLFSSDEDDLDGRSDTIYDSTRTGATGSSHSALRRPAIETIFDESPEKPQDTRRRFAMGQDTSSDETILASGQQRDDAVHSESGQSVPSRVSASCREEASPTPAHFARSSQAGAGPASSVVEFGTGLDDMHDASEHHDEWDFDEPDVSPSARVNGNRKDMRSISNVPPPPVPQITHTLQRFDVSTQAENQQSSNPNVFDWSENPSTEKDGSSLRPKTMNGNHGNDSRGSRLSGRRGTHTMHLRSQSVPVPSNGTDHRHSSNATRLEAWGLGNKGVSEEWDDDFLIEEPDRGSQSINNTSRDFTRASNTSTMVVPRSIMERQASVHGQFGHVKELTLLVEELKRLQQQASAQGIIGGQSAELWKEAEGIINLATVDEDRDSSPERSPRSPSFDFDLSDEESTQTHRDRRSILYTAKDSLHSGTGTASGSPTPSHPSPDKTLLGTPPTSTSRPRKESAAKAKSVLENIYQHRSPHSSPMLRATATPEKLPFDTTSLRDLVTRAGVITRALKEVVRRAEESNKPSDASDAPPPPPPKDPPSPPPDPDFAKMFQRRPPSPSHPPPSSSSPQQSSFPTSSTSPNKSRKMSRAASGTKSPKGSKSPTSNKSLQGNISPKRASSIHKTSIGSLDSETKSLRSPRSSKNGNYVSGGGTIGASNDNDITGHMKIMTVV